MGILHGSDAGKGAILLTAHLDHLGIGPEKKGDRIYNGADDDASGTTAVSNWRECLLVGRDHRAPYSSSCSVQKKLEATEIDTF